ncbi:MAG: DUF4401 domain-containing protein [Gammaproteobacteria bacterium]
MVDLTRFCADFGIDPYQAQQVLDSSTGEADRALPWYVQIIVGVSAWVTAIVTVLFGVALLDFLGIVDLEQPLAILGAGFLAAGLGLLKRGQTGLFLAQLAIALAAAGNAMIAAGIWFQWELWPAAATSVVIAGLVILGTSNRLLQFLSSLFAAGLLVLWLLNDNISHCLDIAAMGTLAGSLILLYPPQKDLRPTAVVLLLMVPLLSAIVDIDPGMLWQASPGGWIAKITSLAIFLWLVVLLWRRTTTRETRLQLAGFAVAAMVVSLVLPAGGSAALVIMMLAFVLGSRPLALLGVLLQIWSLWRFYYDLHMTLLAKSMVLVAVGTVLLALWWLVTRDSSAMVQD